VKELGGFLFAKVCRQYPPYVLGARVTIHDYGHESTVGFFVIASNLRRSNLSEIASLLLKLWVAMTGNALSHSFAMTGQALDPQ